MRKRKKADEVPRTLLSGAPGLSIAGILFLVAFLSRPMDLSFGGENTGKGDARTMTSLPKPPFSKTLSIEEALEKRRSVRRFARRPLTEMEISRLLWAAQGVTGGGRGRTAPSAGGLYPLEVYLVIPEGVYRYHPPNQELWIHRKGDFLGQLSEAALGQASVRGAPAVIVIAAVYERVTGKYGKRGERYVILEAGHAAQNIHLEAAALGLGSVPVGAFQDRSVHAVLGLHPDEEPLYLIPVGEPRP
mgnify:CR=1 FL=1